MNWIIIIRHKMETTYETDFIYDHDFYRVPAFHR